MNWKNIILRSSLLIITGICLCYSLVGDDFNIGILVPILALFLFGVILFISTVIIDIKKFKASNQTGNFIPTLTGLAVIFLVCLILDNLNSPNKSPVIIHAGLSGGGTYTWLTLHADSSYEYFNGSALGGKTIKGNYTLHDSLITLDKQSFDKALISNSLLLSSTTHGHTAICQLDKSGHEIDGSMFLIVHTYNINR